MKKLVLIALTLLTSQLAFAENEETVISSKCLNKITQFSAQFAEASMPYYGSTPASIGKVTVNSKAITVGESGFADGKGSYELIIVDEGEKVTTNIDFTFRFMTEPHCSIMTIKIADVQ